VAANPKIYGLLVSQLGKYSKFATAGEKAGVRQAGQTLSIKPDAEPESEAE
jgi:myo-inositol-1(or 4)-monophosphatase